jgi:hypothetical protein
LCRSSGALAVQESAACALPGVAESPVGAAGAVMALASFDLPLSPPALTAVTL